MSFGIVRDSGDGPFELPDRLIDVAAIESRAAGGDQVGIGGGKRRECNEHEQGGGKLAHGG